jgi:hypothetical protein
MLLKTFYKMLRGLKQRVFFAMQNYIKPEEIELTSGQLSSVTVFN